MEVIICREKNGDFMWDASTPEVRDLSALHILTSRWKQGYWYDEPDAVAEQQRVDELKALIEQATEGGTLKRDLERRLVVAERDLKHEQQAQKWWDRAKRTVDEQDSTEAWALLEERDENEYEGISIETVRSPEGVRV